MASYEYSQNVGPVPTAGGFYQSSFAQPDPTQQGYGGGYFAQPQQGPPPPTNFEDEPPLLEELGINVDHIIAKAKAVLNPFSKFEASFADEADMSGPLSFGLLLGLLLINKAQFGIVYTQSVTSCVAIYLVFNLMSQRGIDLYRSTSILGYALIPMVLLAFVSLFAPRSLKIIIGSVMISWSTSTAAKIFVAVLEMRDNFWLVAYPLALVYTSFALITVFP
eukprot:Plantae.Rhodophyta-Rhodochaete_pulchella.ctg433.p2 GENE.Plantae.Rhodophyta-Rhodochaete_pulchella.ctg433~~Plantae.Rhodophyta-Rhodochaete_pulchella.ctg433.p2  ORF type:complete len:235 (+),score=26.57 Plantae.Rhodophyta-Rhodochaete_pulchella.ctg433:45-707(+)